MQGIEMAEPLEVFFSPALVRRLAADLARAHPALERVHRPLVAIQMSSSGIGLPRCFRPN